MTATARQPRQFTIRGLLIVTTLAAIAFAVWRAFGGGIGLFELVLASIAGLSILLAAAVPRWPWAWFAGLCLCMLAIWLLVPAPRDVKLMGAAAFGGLYAALGGPLLLISRSGARRWPWTLAATACVYAAIVITPADAVSALFALWPFALIYAGAAIWWFFRQRRAAAVGD